MGRKRGNALNPEDFKLIEQQLIPQGLVIFMYETGHKEYGN